VGGDPDGGARRYGRAAGTRLNLAAPGRIPENPGMHQPTTLRVQVLGPFAVARDGLPLPAHELASRRAAGASRRPARPALRLPLAGRAAPRRAGSRLDPAAAERLLELAGTYGSAKYRTLGLARLGRHEEAVRVAAPVASDYLLAQVATGPAARRRPHRRRAPAGAAPRFLECGRLARATARA
jgi:hypothetical protein